MYTVHRLDSKERTHYLLERRHAFVVKPKLLYAGKLKRSKNFREEPHSHNFAEILLITSGEGSTTVEGVYYEIKKGDLLLYNAGAEHRELSNPENPLEAYFTAFDHVKLTDLEENHLLPSGYPAVFQTRDAYPKFLHGFQNLIGEFLKKEPFYEEIAQSLSETLVMYLYRLVNAYEDTTGLLAKNQSFVRALEYVDENYRRDFTIDELAGLFYLNKFYLAHLFKAEKKTSIRNYILNRRLNEAKELLTSTQKTVTEISEETGFNNLNYFCRSFKQNFHMTPLQFRHSRRSEHT